MRAKAKRARRLLWAVVIGVALLDILLFLLTMGRGR